MVAVLQLWWGGAPRSACLTCRSVFISLRTLLPMYRARINMQKEAWKIMIFGIKITFNTFGHLVAPCGITLTHPLMGANQRERWIALVPYRYQLVPWPIHRQQITVVWDLWGCTRWIVDGWSCGYISQRYIRIAGGHCRNTAVNVLEQTCSPSSFHPSTLGTAVLY